MGDYGITSKGFILKRLDEIYSSVCDALKENIGVDPSENPQSILNVLTTIFCDQIASVWEDYSHGYENLFPLTAEGVALDRCMQIGGVSRIGKARTTYLLSCTGKEGTTIPAGALVQTSTSPVRQFQCASIETITIKNWASLTIQPIDNISGTFTFSFSIERNATSGDVGTVSSSSKFSKKLTVTSYDDAINKMVAALQGFKAFESFNCNFAYEPNYTRDDAAQIYSELRNLSNWLIETRCFSYISILEADIGTPNDPADDRNYCGGTGNMLAFAPDGKAYPCIRYAPISIGEEKASKVCFGDCHNGLYSTEQQRKVKEELDSITLTSQSTDECIHCPVARGCGWCSGYNYELYGTANKRYTGICYAHKARVLSACYYQNKRCLEIGDVEPKKIYLPQKEAEEIIGAELSEELFSLEKKAEEKEERIRGDSGR